MSFTRKPLPSSKTSARGSLRHRRPGTDGDGVGLVLVLVAFVSAAAIAAVGPSVFQPDQAATEEDPASVGTAPEPESPSR